MRTEAPIRVTLPSNVNLDEVTGAAFGGHRVVQHGRHLDVTASENSRHIETVLRDVFLRTLVSGASGWAGDLRRVLLDRIATDAFLIVDGPTLSEPGWVDRYVFTGDLSHRVLFERRLSGRQGAPALWVLDQTGVTDLCQAPDGALRDTPLRSALAQLLAPTRRWMDSGDHGQIDGIAIVNLTTARSGPSQPLGAYRPPKLDTVPAAERFTEQAARRAALVVGAWGVVEHDYHVVRLTRTIERAGQQLHGLVTTRKGQEVRWLTTGRPAQPRMPRGLSADSRPVPLEELRSDRELPLP